MTVSGSLPNFGPEDYNSATYGDSFADVYDDWYSDLNDADFVESLCRILPNRPAHICELGVGTARLISAIATRRLPVLDVVVGVDTSEAMLNIARHKTANDSVTYLLADFSRNISTGPYDLIFAGYNTFFNLANEESMRSCLSLVANTLTPNGSFFVDLARPLHTENGSYVEIRSSTTSSTVLSFSHHEVEHQRMSGQFIEYTQGIPGQPRRWAVHYLSPEQLDSYATDADLVLVNRSEDGHGSVFTADSRRHISQYRRLP